MGVITQLNLVGAARGNQSHACQVPLENGRRTKVDEQFMGQSGQEKYRTIQLPSERVHVPQALDVIVLVRNNEAPRPTIRSCTLLASLACSVCRTASIADLAQVFGSTGRRPALGAAAVAPRTGGLSGTWDSVCSGRTLPFALQGSAWLQTSGPRHDGGLAWRTGICGNTPLRVADPWHLQLRLERLILQQCMQMPGAAVAVKARLW